ncbi:GNAT family N-acetyltransferase [Halosimplex halobium]|uniref:GNAT family N-acetyltransferase n=1 Tax=Halosimplex halobium TaxID=3396618 RepID=UPI003F5731B1
MEIRDARASDAQGIADTARASLRESYDFLADGTIDEVVEEWYDGQRVADQVNDEDSAWLVAEDDDAVVGFVQGVLVDAEPPVGEIHWLHVAPDAREEGLAQQLLGGIQETFEKRGAGRLRGTVLAENEAGWSFYEADGFDRVDEREVTVAGDAYDEYVYERAMEEAAEDLVVEAVETPAGELFVNFSEGERGSKAPFYATYRSRDLAERYGWYCSNCESVSTAMDSMGHIECNDCGNRRKATRWDASYL